MRPSAARVESRSRRPGPPFCPIHDFHSLSRAFRPSRNQLRKSSLTPSQLRSLLNQSLACWLLGPPSGWPRLAPRLHRIPASQPSPRRNSKLLHGNELPVPFRARPSAPVRVFNESQHLTPALSKRWRRWASSNPRQILWTTAVPRSEGRSRAIESALTTCV